MLSFWEQPWQMHLCSVSLDAGHGPVLAAAAAFVAQAVSARMCLCR